MNHYNVSILKADLSYVIEAIRMRGYAIAEQIAAQANNQERISEQVKELAKDAAITVSVQDSAKPSKPKDPRKAPWGYKKDGTPKKAPGRPRIAK